MEALKKKRWRSSDGGNSIPFFAKCGFYAIAPTSRIYRVSASTITLIGFTIVEADDSQPEALNLLCDLDAQRWVP